MARPFKQEPSALSITVIATNAWKPSAAILGTQYLIIVCVVLFAVN
jgi:hypothetical protein